MLDLQFFLSWASNSAPTLVGLVGLCLLPWFPRNGRGTATAGLVLLTAGPLMDPLLVFGLNFPLRTAGLHGLADLLAYASSFMIAAALLLLGLAATRGIRQATEARQGAPGPPPPGAFQPPHGPAQPGYPKHGPHGGA